MTEVPARKTPLTRPAAAAAVRAAFCRVFAREPERHELAILLAQSEHESGAWLRMWNFNFAGVKAYAPWVHQAGNTHVMLRTREGHGADVREVREPFRAFATAESGAVDWLLTLARFWPAALSEARSGSPRAFVEALVRGPRKYFTGSPGEYSSSVIRLFDRWMIDLQTGSATVPTAPTAQGTCVTVAGYHRAKQAEVTPEIAKAAQAALKEMRLGRGGS